ncbi:STAS domain-containing protein [Streptomyces sp. NPDC051320]|uniref:STAS domain-containing protein n=1 Tax=Streptomyces sp. NPDC051320 TaxID=3154644 RepID=UPI00342BBA83
MSSVRRAGLPLVDVTGPIALVVAGPVGRADVPRLCAELRALLTSTGASVVDCDVGALTCPDLAAVEAVVRLRLTARRHGSRVRLRNAAPALVALLELVGLADVS